MRSFAGVVHTDGSPPDERVLHGLGEILRLPDSSPPAFQVDDHCGLVTVSHRSGGAAGFSRPNLAGSIRLDRRNPVDADDDELTVRAWQRWDADCVSHLFGDFAFAIWDPATRELFCARDRFGVRPFYYARIDRGLVFSDSLDAVIAHPAVRVDELDEGAVADYLLHGVSDDFEATIYAQVRRLPPAHTLTCRRGGIVLRRYWNVPEYEKPGRDAPERLESALAQAVADRVTDDSAVVFMSGGLDSTSIAALAHEQRPGMRLEAFTSVYRTRIPDVEEPYAVEAARSIGIAIRPFPLDEYPVLDAVEKGIWTADPGPLLTATMTHDLFAAAASIAPIALHGHPADAVLFSDPIAITRDLWRERRLLRLSAALVRYTAARRRPPYFFARQLLGIPRNPPLPPDPPDWLRIQPPERARPLHPLGSPAWSSYLEWSHPLQTRSPIEVRYPWCDVRVIEAAMSLEPIPWLVDKHVTRRMLRGRVSEKIRRRRKSFLHGDPFTVALPAVIDVHAASRYIDPERFRRACIATRGLAGMTLRGVLFAYWMRSLPGAVAAFRNLY